jgi:hypothetical protein
VAVGISEKLAESRSIIYALVHIHQSGAVAKPSGALDSAIEFAATRLVGVQSLFFLANFRRIGFALESGEPVDFAAKLLAVKSRVTIIEPYGGGAVRFSLQKRVTAT